ncbi:hypothetical protein F4677DRAFT_445850 [Hypoxylon crocopeplum]|nr:hypothetical protein F4677DRAFT_445850 [Hypoxylon crocopeplum]
MFWQNNDGAKCTQAPHPDTGNSASEEEVKENVVSPPAPDEADEWECIQKWDSQHDAPEPHVECVVEQSIEKGDWIYMTCAPNNDNEWEDVSKEEKRDNAVDTNNTNNTKDSLAAVRGSTPTTPPRRRRVVIQQSPRASGSAVASPSAATATVTTTIAGPSAGGEPSSNISSTLNVPKTRRRLRHPLLKITDDTRSHVCEFTRSAPVA